MDLLAVFIRHRIAFFFGFISLLRYFIAFSLFLDFKKAKILDIELQDNGVFSTYQVDTFGSIGNPNFGTIDDFPFLLALLNVIVITLFFSVINSFGHLVTFSSEMIFNLKTCKKRYIS